MKLLKYSLLVLYIMIISLSSKGQANYWATYPGFGDYPSYYKYKVNCNQTPSPDVMTSAAFTTLPHEIFDSLGYNYQIEGVNTVFDPDGNPLFAVDIHGIYNVTTKATSWCCPMVTNRIYPFSSFYSSACPAISEIEIFPIPYECNRYYVLFWERECDARTGDFAGLRQVVVNTSTSTPSIVSDSFIMNIPYHDGIYGIVADAVRTGGKRSVYAIYPLGPGNIGIDRLAYNEDGTFLGSSLLTPPLPEAGSRIFELTADGTIGYISIDLSTLNTYNVNTTTFKTYTPTEGIIRGFEYVPKLNYWYISYLLPPTTPFHGNGGLGYFDLNASPATYTEISAAPTTATSSGYRVGDLSECAYTDLELAKNGYLYLIVNHDTLNRYGYFKDFGMLAYINTNNPVTAVQGPYFAYTSVPNGDPILLKSTIDNGLAGCCSSVPPNNGRSYYLGNQIDYEDYNGYFRPTSDPNSFTINHQTPDIYQGSPCPTITETFQDICFGSPIEYEFLPRISSDEAVGMIHWAEIDDCGNIVPGGVAGHSANINWIGPFDVLDITKVPKGAGNQLNDPAMIGKKLAVYFDATSSCTYNTNHYFYANIRLVPSDPITNVQVTIDASGTSYVPLSTSCSTALGACGVNPYIRFSQKGLASYWMIIQDYGLSCGAPTLVGAGVASPTPVSSTSPPDIIESLQQYLWIYCGYPSLTSAANYFVTHPNHTYGVQVFGNNACGTQTLDEMFFIGAVGCKVGTTGVNNPDIDSEIKIYPNPANDLIKIECSKDVIGAIYNIKEITGKRLLNGRINISGQSISIDAFSPGIYIFEILKQDKIIQTLRFTKQ